MTCPCKDLGELYTVGDLGELYTVGGADGEIGELRIVDFDVVDDDLGFLSDAVSLLKDGVDLAKSAFGGKKKKKRPAAGSSSNKKERAEDLEDELEQERLRNQFARERAALQQQMRAKERELEVARQQQVMIANRRERVEKEKFHRRLKIAGGVLAAGGLAYGTYRLTKRRVRP